MIKTYEMIIKVFKYDGVNSSINSCLVRIMTRCNLSPVLQLPMK